MYPTKTGLIKKKKGENATVVSSDSSLSDFGRGLRWREREGVGGKARRTEMTSVKEKAKKKKIAIVTGLAWG